MITVGESRCTGCRTCEFACSFQQRGSFHYKYSLIEIRPNEKTPGFFKPRLCRHCKNPPCRKACPEYAISKNKDSGIVSIDRNKCTGCGLCVEACPWRIPKIYPEQEYAAVCDLCGGDPLCVKFCGPGALQIGEN